MTPTKGDNPDSQPNTEQPQAIGKTKSPSPDANHTDKPNTIDNIGPRLLKYLEIVIILAGVAGAVLGLKVWQESEIDKAVKKALGDDAFLRKVAEQAQPMLIFNDVGGIVSDSGGLAYIEAIIIEEKSGGMPGKILVRPKKLLPQAPLLSTVDGIQLNYSAYRKTGLDWEYAITNYMIMKAEGGAENCRFRLEILR